MGELLLCLVISSLHLLRSWLHHSSRSKSHATLFDRYSQSTALFPRHYHYDGNGQRVLFDSSDLWSTPGLPMWSIAGLPLNGMERGGSMFHSSFQHASHTIAHVLTR